MYFGLVFALKPSVDDSFVTLQTFRILRHPDSQKFALQLAQIWVQAVIN